ncbi:MAG: hypothetical protein U0232_11105 [Thermomicrobiales bacterium]
MPSATARISVIRPRGEEVSTFVSTHVGQEVRQKPQRTQSLINSRLGASRPVKPCFCVTSSRKDIVCVATASPFSWHVTRQIHRQVSLTSIARTPIPARDRAGDRS